MLFIILFMSVSLAFCADETYPVKSTDSVMGDLRGWRVVSVEAHKLDVKQEVLINKHPVRTEDSLRASFQLSVQQESNIRYGAFAGAALGFVLAGPSGAFIGMGSGATVAFVLNMCLKPSDKKAI